MRLQRLGIRLMNQLLLTVALGVLLLRGALTSAVACSCLPPPPPLSSAEASDAVFVGRVISVGSTDPTDRFAHLEVVFEVVEGFKGVGAAERMTVFTASDGALCGYGFTVEETYVVYAHRSRGGLWTGLCDRTRQVGRGEADITALRTIPQPLRLSVARVDEGVQIVVEGAESKPYALEVSLDFVSWNAIAEIVPANRRYEVPGVIQVTQSAQFFRLREVVENQGIYGITLLLPGVCLEDPERPGECLNQPFPGSFSYDIRAFSDTPDLGRENPVVTSFQSRDSYIFKFITF